MLCTSTHQCETHTSLHTCIPTCTTHITPPPNMLMHEHTHTWPLPSPLYVLYHHSACTPISTCTCTHIAMRGLDKKRMGVVCGEVVAIQTKLHMSAEWSESSPSSLSLLVTDHSKNQSHRWLLWGLVWWQRGW